MTEQLQIWKDITDNITLIIGTLSGGLVGVLIGLFQARYQFKQTKYKEMAGLRRDAIKNYVSEIYDHLNIYIGASEEERRKSRSRLLIAQAILLPLLKGSDKEELIKLTEKTLYSTPSHKDIEQLLKSLKY